MERGSQIDWDADKDREAEVGMERKKERGQTKRMRERSPKHRDIMRRR